MTSAEIRQSFLEFFAKRGHTIVPSAALLPNSPGLLFTNAGMNQFVPIFLGDRRPDVAHWAGVKAGMDTRAADTQKCIRAGGKHNDLEDVGFDTYHHTFFEMLGNWSFGDYFKKDSLAWGWELLTGDPAKGCWGIPPKRLFATVYWPEEIRNQWDLLIRQNIRLVNSGADIGPEPWDTDAQDKFYGPDASAAKIGLLENCDLESLYRWTKIFMQAGLRPEIHIVPGNRKDNFWMMGDTGPCGPCSEIHFNLSPTDDEAAGRKLVNAGQPRCIEIWNHVFIQFNANHDGGLLRLAARHVDTGMGFERVAGIYAVTKGFKDFGPEPSNYAADIFAPLFQKVAELSGKTYGGTVPAKRESLSEQEKVDVAFRVLADHARCVACAIADSILPGNKGRNYVIRRILRRAVLYGRKSLELEVGFFEQLVSPIVDSLGSVFPELKQQQDLIRHVIRSEEQAFNRTLDEGLHVFQSFVRLRDDWKRLLGLVEPHISSLREACSNALANTPARREFLAAIELDAKNLWWTLDEKCWPWEMIASQEEKLMAYHAHNIVNMVSALWDEAAPTVPGIFDLVGRISAELDAIGRGLDKVRAELAVFSGRAAFVLKATYGFPLDMTQLLAAERGITVDIGAFDAEMAKHQEISEEGQQKEIIVAATEGEKTTEQQPTKFLGYTQLTAEAKVIDVVKSGQDTFLVFDQTPFYAEMGGQAGDHGAAKIGGEAIAIVATIKDDAGRYLHRLAPACALDLAKVNVVGQTATLAVSPLNRRAITRHHTAAHLLHWALRKVLGTHVHQAGTSKTKTRLRFDFSHFEQVRPDQLREIEHLVNSKVFDNSKVETYEVEFDKKPADTLAFFGEKYGKIVRVVDIGGYSRELCGGTHVTTTSEIGLVKIVAEMAIAAGTRRIEAVAGQAAYDFVEEEEEALKGVSSQLSAGPLDVAKKVEVLLAHRAELEKKLKSLEQRAASGLADELAAGAKSRDGLKFVSAVVAVESPEALRGLGAQVMAKLGEGVVQLGAASAEKAAVVVLCSPAAIKAGRQAGKIVAELSAKLGGKGGGKPDFAMGGGRDVSKLAEVLKP